MHGKREREEVEEEEKKKNESIETCIWHPCHDFSENTNQFSMCLAQGSRIE